MGGRGAFEDVNIGNFNFVDGGQVYKTIGTFDDVQVLIQEKGAVKAPDFSHTENDVHCYCMGARI